MSINKYLLIIFSISLILPANASAEETFNKNFILSDEEMQDWRTMDEGAIQNFLAERSSYLTNFFSPDYKDKRKSASSIIYQAAKEYSINPKYLLVKLQKEQSLVTETQKPKQTRLDWATGYACPDSAPCNEKYKGFGKQVDAAAGIIRWYYDNQSSQSWIKKEGGTYTIDGETVIPASDATGFLYTYTPHIHGNKNFWKIWQQWFQQVYPDGTLLKATNDTTVYLIQNGKKKAFKTFSALSTRFDPNRIISVPSSELARYEQGSDISLPNYSIIKKKDTSQYYLLDFDTLRPFESEDTIKKIGYHPDEIIEVSSADLAEYSISKKIIKASEAASPLGRLVKTKENGKIFYIKNNAYHPVIDKKTAEINFPHLTMEEVITDDLRGLAVGKQVAIKDGTLVIIDGDPHVYVIEHGKRRHITSEEVFNGLGYKWEHVVRLNQFSGFSHPEGSPLYLRNQAPLDLEEEQEDNSVVADGPTPKEIPQKTNTEETKPPTPAGPTDETGEVYTTPESKTVYSGQKISTNINAYYIANYDTGALYSAKNADVVRPIASLTKVMTGYRLIKEGLNMSGSTTYDPIDHKSIYHRFRVAPGEKIKNSDLYNALMVSSLNTPANMLVSEVEPSRQQFIRRMNEEADKLGLKNTTFADASGIRLHNLSTAKEYARLFANLSKNATVRKALSTKTYEYDEIIDKDDKPHHFDNHSNKLLAETDLPYTIIASKTGYLHEAGSCLAMIVERPSDKKRFVIVTLGNPDYVNRFNEPNKLATYAINNF